MADTAIEWASKVWNPTTGCDRVSPGCDHCYALKMSARLKGMGSPKYQRDGDPRTSGPGFGLSVHPDTLNDPAGWRKPERIFVNSMSDLGHSDIPDGFLVRIWEVMARTPWHTYMILTKRPARLRSFLRRWYDTAGDDEVSGPSEMPPMPRGPDAVREVYSSPRARLFADMLDSMGEPPEGAAYPLYDWMEGPRFFPEVLNNVWIGVSAEDQERAELRIPILREIPAAIRFVSLEPLLGPIDLLGDAEDPGPAITRKGVQLHPSGPWGPAEYDYDDQVEIDWAIVGGESGPGARPMHPRWAQSLHQQCERADISFSFKQWGSWGPLAPLNEHGQFDYKGCHTMCDDGTLYGPGDLIWPDGPRVGEALRSNFRFHHPTTMFRVGKKKAGRELYHDGRTFDAAPDPVSPIRVGDL